MEKILSVEERLRRNRIVATRIDYAICTCMVAAPVLAISMGLVHQWDSPGPLWVKAVAAFFVGMIISYPGVKVLASLGRAVEARFAPTWVVDASDPAVVRIVGSIPQDQWWAAKSALVNERPGYHICDDAFGRFGCTLAAVPATK